MQTAWNSNGSFVTAIFGAQCVELADRLGQLLARHHRAGPAVTDTGGAPERHIGVAADVERHRLRRRRAHLQLVEVVELAVELDHATAEDQLDHLDHLVDTGSTPGVGDSAPLEFLWSPADSDAECKPVIGQIRHRTDLTGQQ